MPEVGDSDHSRDAPDDRRGGTGERTGEVTEGPSTTSPKAQRVADLDLHVEGDETGSNEGQPLGDSPGLETVSMVPRGTKTEATDDPRGRYELLSIDSIRPNPHQPRELFSPEAIEQLAASIKSSGLIQPITVRRGDGHFELVAGERRLRACRLAGLTTIPAIIRDLTDRETAEWALVENLQREDLNPIERAQGLRRLIDEFGLTHQQAAETVGLERASVSNILRLLELDPTTISLVARGTIGQGHAKVLLAVQDVALRTELCQSVVAKNWSVRRLESEVRRLLAPASVPAAQAPPGSNTAGNPQVEHLQRDLSEYLGTRVQISTSKRQGQGRILIDFHSLEQFDGVMERIGFSAR